MALLDPPGSQRPGDARSAAGAVAVLDTLTNREREILQLVAEGFTSPAIGRRLSISPRTAEAHRAAVLRKLHLGNQTAVFRYALARGVIPLPERLFPGMPRLRNAGTEN